MTVNRFIVKWTNIWYLYALMFTGSMTGAGDAFHWDCERQINWWKRNG